MTRPFSIQPKRKGPGDQTFADVGMQLTQPWCSPSDLTDTASAETPC